MNRRHALGIGLILSLAVLVSCGTNDGLTSPKAIDGVLLRASDLPSMRLQSEDPFNDAMGMAEVLGGPEACACPTVFKDEPGVVTEKLKGFGFKRGYAELWSGAGLHASAFAAEFDTADHAKAALDYMNTELFRECVDEPFCSTREKINNAAIPDFVGLAITPLRPKEQGRQATLYKFLFRIGAVVYGAMDGASDAYDPGSVSRAQALEVVQGLYVRVMNRDISDVLRSAPPSSTHPGVEGSPPASFGKLEDAIRAAPASHIKSPSASNRAAMLGVLDDVEALAAEENFAEALQKLKDLRQRLDGCGATADQNDWIIDCGSQQQMRAFIDDLIANLSN